MSKLSTQYLPIYLVQSKWKKFRSSLREDIRIPKTERKSYTYGKMK